MSYDEGYEDGHADGYDKAYAWRCGDYEEGYNDGQNKACELIRALRSKVDDLHEALASRNNVDYALGFDDSLERSTEYIDQIERELTELRFKIHNLEETLAVRDWQLAKAREPKDLTTDYISGPALGKLVRQGMKKREANLRSIFSGTSFSADEVDRAVIDFHDSMLEHVMKEIRETQ